MAKEIVFDFDGVIADSFGLIVEIFGLSSENIEIFRNQGFKILVDRLNIQIGDLVALNEKCQKKISERIGDIRIFDGIDKVVIDLKRNGNNLGILTTNTKENVEFVLKKFGISDCFDYIYCEKGWFGKDKVIEKLIDEKGFKKEDVIYIGDEVRDIEAMKKAGVKIIAVTWGYNFRKVLEKYQPDWLVDSGKELLTVINKSNGY